MADLIDPLNEDTYDDRVIVHGPLRSKISTEAYRRGWERAFGKKIKIKINRRKILWLNQIKSLHTKSAFGNV